MSAGTDPISAPALVPELLVTDVTRSLEFWCGLCGFDVAFDRPDEGFAYLALGGAHVMLEQQGIGRNWVSGDLEAPFGRGINFQIEVPDLAPILSKLAGAPWPLFMEPETKWYRVSGHEEVGVRQFCVTDPDGYLIRFQTSFGRRPIGDGVQAMPHGRTARLERDEDGRLVGRSDTMVIDQVMFSMIAARPRARLRKSRLSPMRREGRGAPEHPRGSAWSNVTATIS